MKRLSASAAKGYRRNSLLNGGLYALAGQRASRRRSSRTTTQEGHDGVAGLCERKTDRAHAIFSRLHRSMMSVDQIPVKLHRCRFVDHLPAAITALAFPPLPLPSRKRKATVTSPLKFPHLAIGRANGNIELAEWSNNNPTDQAPQAWVVLKVGRRFLSMSSHE
jgi:hypothetical protein